MIIENNYFPVFLDPIEDQGMPAEYWPHVHFSTDKSERTVSHVRSDKLSVHRVSQSLVASRSVNDQ